VCGIAGVFDYRERRTIPLDRDAAIAMVDVLVHRGPDDGGVWAEPGVVLGHRRLSILDVSADGHQPFVDPASGCVLVYNGEIYNYRELRSELIGCGHHFRSQSDTEVILRGYLEWGRSLVTRLNGMFAWALYDPRESLLWMVRDGIGIKPLFVHDDGQRVWFGSEIKAILSVRPELAKPDPVGLSRFLAFGYASSPYTGFQRIGQLCPGEEWIVRRGKAMERSRWFRLPYPPSRPKLGMDEAVEQLDQSLERATARQMVSDVPVGAMLSGGLDSSAIVRSLSQQTPGLQTFSAGFTESSFDERSFARRVASRYGTSHHEVTIEDDAWQILGHIVSHAEEPLADNSAIPLYYLSRFMRQSVTVALNGDGADELLGGYDTYRASQLAAWMRLSPQWARASVLPRLLQLLPNSVAKYNTKMLLTRFLMGSLYPAPRDHTLWRSMVPPELQKQLLLPEAMEAMRDPWNDYASALDDAPDWLGPLDRQLHMDLRFHLPNGLLVKTDRMSMAHGLEVRVPWLDNEVVAACLGLPSNLKRIGRNGKRILKHMLSQDLPRDITHRRKAGFLAPIESWMQGRWQALIRSQLTESFALDIGFLRWPTLKQMLAEHESRRIDHAYALYTLLILSLWYDRWIRRSQALTMTRPNQATPTRIDLWSSTPNLS
jgi:asparagine synthase (glutamine-hydrolysing)